MAESSEKTKKDTTPPYLYVLKLIDRLEFPVGKKLLAKVLHGDSSARIRKLNLDKKLEYGALDLYDMRDIDDLFDRMIAEGLIEITSKHNKYMKIVKITEKGLHILRNPSGAGNSYASNYNHYIRNLASITDKDREAFRALGSFLEMYNDEQKKAIIDSSSHILCIAGAGSGKTTVLTKRIEFLVKYKSIDPRKILAVTFTRKARQEMMKRLNQLGINVHIETFNSFCEKILNRNSDIAYSQPYRIMSNKDKIRIVHEALSKIGYTVDEALESYYNSRKIGGEDKRLLFLGFINDLFSLMDNYRNYNKPLSVFKEQTTRLNSYKDKQTAEFIYNLISLLDELKKKYGLRDYTDQLVHTIRLFKEHPSVIPEFEHVLVDEYQDVNHLQVKLLNLLSPSNLFVVGDPRQSIYGWRGSSINYILKFNEFYKDSSIIQLTKNYRSSKKIVDVGNEIIKSMGLPPMESVLSDNGEVVLLSHENEQAEALFLAHSIKSLDKPRNEIFVLTRTNKQLELIAEVLAQNNIKYLKRTVEEKNENLQPKPDEITLSTVHAIKGLEAEVVYLAGVTSNMYPCMASEHPVLDMAKINSHYNKYDEELRLLYVGVTRARKKLIISHYNSVSRFITPGVKKLLKTLDNASIGITYNASKPQKSDTEARLRQWRLRTAKTLNTKPYMIFSDRTLLELATIKPQKLKELEGIAGLTPLKINKYGREILRVINGL